MGSELNKTQRRFFGAAIFTVLAIISVVSRFIPMLGFVNFSGVLVGYFYSAMFTGTGPTGWGHKEVLLMTFSSTAIYGLLALWAGMRGRSFFQTESRETLEAVGFEDGFEVGGGGGPGEAAFYEVQGLGGYGLVGGFVG